MKVDQDKLQELCDSIDLLEYAENTVDFKKRGIDEYAAHCPLHKDKTPSLMITKSRNLFYCHSCHVGGNIINWMMIFEHLRFDEAVLKVSKLAGADVSNLKTSESLSFYKQLKRFSDQYIHQKIERDILPDSYLDRFAHDEIPQEWVQEGILPSVMSEYGVCIDNASNRICYPIYDNADHLIGMKGRTRFYDYKRFGIKKYQNYTSIKTTDFFVGMKQNRDEIQKAGCVTIFEGLKSGMKLSSWGLGQCWLASETSRINQSQTEILIGMKLREVTIAFDRDVDMKSIRDCTKMLRKFTNVYVVRDRCNKDRLLPGDKDSPVDAGKEVWLKLFNERRRL